jgi:hypothetical protein
MPRRGDAEREETRSVARQDFRIIAGSPPDDATLIRVSLPDRPGGLALVAARLAEHGVDILRVEVVEAEAGVAVDDLLVTGGDLDAALAALEPETSVLGRRAHAELPDPGLAMAAAAISVTSSSSLGEARRALVSAAIELVAADSGVVLRDAGHGWLRPLAATADSLPPIRESQPALPRRALARGAPLVSTAEEWAPPHYVAALGSGSALAVPAGTPPYLVLTVVRRDAFPFVEAEIERLQALLRVALGVLGALGERAVRAPEAPAVNVRLGIER